MGIILSTLSVGYTGIFRVRIAAREFDVSPRSRIFWITDWPFKSLRGGWENVPLYSKTGTTRESIRQRRPEIKKNETGNWCLKGQNPRTHRSKSDQRERNRDRGEIDTLR
jgi:hypothetical protein